MVVINLMRKHEFSPEELNDLWVAYENACAAMGAREEPETKTSIARALASMGENDPIRLYTQTIHERRWRLTIPLPKPAR